MIYRTFIEPYLRYCSIVWGQCNETQKDKLQALQNKAARTITKVKFTDADHPRLLRDLGWLDVRNFLELDMGIFMYKCQNCDNENYKKSRNKVQRMIKDKKKNFVIGKLNDNIGKPKELWKSLKSLGLPSKESSSATICLEKDGILSFDPKTNAEIFKDFYSNLANNLVKKLPTPPK